MPILTDFLAAKAELRERFLKPGNWGATLGVRRSMRIADAAASATVNVHSIGIGRKLVGGKATRQLCLRLYVARKLPESVLSAASMLPTKINGIPTDVIESPPAMAMARAKALSPCSDQRRERQRPVIAGISTGHYRITAGTLGYFCKSTRPGENKTYALSNNHVYADMNKGQVGDELRQPGTADGGGSGDKFATLTRFVPIDLSGKPNQVDAAIGEVFPGIGILTQVCSIGKISGSEAAKEGMRVRKHGRTSGYTEGTVSDIHYDTTIGMGDTGPNAAAVFENQIRIEVAPPYAAFGLGGDSGSLVVRQDKLNAVGLYFAGPEDGSYGVANHLDEVLRELQITLA